MLKFDSSVIIDKLKLKRNIFYNYFTKVMIFHPLKVTKQGKSAMIIPFNPAAKREKSSPAWSLATRLCRLGDEKNRRFVSLKGRSSVG
jgi:hypothetical protein